jgi:hypothetical protein
MTRFNSRPSPAYDAARRALAQVLEDEGLDAVERAVADATWAARLARFGDGKSGPGDAHVCLHRLLGERCPDSRKRSCDSPPRLLTGQHTSEWQQNGHTVAIVSQPYALAHDDLQGYLAVCARHGLQLTVSAETSWHFPGHSLAVILTRDQPLHVATTSPQSPPEAAGLRRLMAAWPDLSPEQRDRISAVINEFVVDTGAR